MNLILKKSDLQAVFEHCDREYPNEACGILSGKEGRVEKIYRMTNAERSPSFYVMDPQEQFRVMKEMRQAGQELVGIYHSHTGGRAYPSATDVDLAYYPEAVYLIISLLDKKNPMARGFRIRERKISEIAVNVYS